jgi:hypothetical protein
VAVLIWTAVSIFTSQRKVKIDAELTDLAKPIVPRLDAEVFSMIEQKRQLSDEELSSFPIYVYLVSENARRGDEGVFTNITDLQLEPDDQEIVQEITPEENSIENL